MKGGWVDGVEWEHLADVAACRQSLAAAAAAAIRWQLTLIKWLLC